jgi:hypothetical protein
MYVICAFDLYLFLLFMSFSYYSLPCLCYVSHPFYFTRYSHQLHSSFYCLFNFLSVYSYFPLIFSYSLSLMSLFLYTIPLSISFLPTFFHSSFISYTFLFHCTTSRKASNRNEYQEYLLGGKGGRCVGLTTLQPSCADCLESWESQPPGTLGTCQGL